MHKSVVSSWPKVMLAIRTSRREKKCVLKMEFVVFCHRHHFDNMLIILYLAKAQTVISVWNPMWHFNDVYAEIVYNRNWSFYCAHCHVLVFWLSWRFCMLRYCASFLSLFLSLASSCSVCSIFFLSEFWMQHNNSNNKNIPNQNQTQ